MKRILVVIVLTSLLQGCIHIILTVNKDALPSSLVTSVQPCYDLPTYPPPAPLPEIPEIPDAILEDYHAIQIILVSSIRTHREVIKDQNKRMERYWQDIKKTCLGE